MRPRREREERSRRRRESPRMRSIMRRIEGLPPEELEKLRDKLNEMLSEPEPEPEEPSAPEEQPPGEPVWDEENNRWWPTGRGENE